MYITEIFLQGFRNLSQLHIEPSEGINVIYGSNAQGKTNFLESLYFCAMGRSMRGKSDQQLIAFDAQESHIRLLVQTQNRRDKIDVHLKQNEKKGIAVNGLPVKRLGELFGTLYAVIFSPEDLSLVKDAPTERRRFLDMELCQLSRVLRFAAVLSDSEAAEQSAQGNTEKAIPAGNAFCLERTDGGIRRAHHCRQKAFFGASG